MPNFPNIFVFIPGLLHVLLSCWNRIRWRPRTSMFKQRLFADTAPCHYLKLCNHIVHLNSWSKFHLNSKPNTDVSNPENSFESVVIESLCLNAVNSDGNAEMIQTKRYMYTSFKCWQPSGKSIPPWQAKCVEHCAISFNYRHSIFDGWLIAEWLARWLPLWVAKGVQLCIWYQLVVDSKLRTMSWSNSLIICIYSAVSPRKHVRVIHPYSIKYICFHKQFIGKLKC